MRQRSPLPPALLGTSLTIPMVGRLSQGREVVAVAGFFFLWGRGGGGVAERPINILVYLRDGSPQTIVRAATLREKFQIKLAASPSHNILSPGQQVPALTQ